MDSKKTSQVVSPGFNPDAQTTEVNPLTCCENHCPDIWFPRILVSEGLQFRDEETIPV